jgi:hypothetical protein
MIRVIRNLNCNYHNEHYANGIRGRWITNGYHMLCLLHWMLFVVWYQQVPLVWVRSHPFWVFTPTQVLWQVLWVNCFIHAALAQSKKKRTREREREVWITLRLLYSLPKIMPPIPINAGDTWRSFLLIQYGKRPHQSTRFWDDLFHNQIFILNFASHPLIIVEILVAELGCCWLAFNISSLAHRSVSSSTKLNLLIHPCSSIILTFYNHCLLNII